MNLHTIPEIATRFNVVAGLSDHSLSPEISLAAVALGASIIEKHFTVRRADGSLDAAFSMGAHELRHWVDGICTVERALGKATFEFDERQKENLVFRRSIFVIQAIRQGEVLTRDNIRSICPGHGLPPKHFEEVLGRRVNKDIHRGTPLIWNDLK